MKKQMKKSSEAYYITLCPHIHKFKNKTSLNGFKVNKNIVNH